MKNKTALTIEYNTRNVAWVSAEISYVAVGSRGMLSIVRGDLDRMAEMQKEPST